MKAKIVRQKVYGSVIDWNHGGGFTVKRLVVEEKDNLAITPHNDQVYVFTGFNLDADCEIIGEVEVSNELVEEALAFIRAKAELNSHMDSFKALLN